MHRHRWIRDDGLTVCESCGIVFEPGMADEVEVTGATGSDGSDTDGRARGRRGYADMKVEREELIGRVTAGGLGEHRARIEVDKMIYAELRAGRW